MTKSSPVDAGSTERYPGRYSTVAPAALLALPFALACGLGLLMVTATGRIQVPGYNERIAILIGSIFCGLCAWTLIKVGISGFYLEITLTDEAILLRQPGRSRVITWEELKRVVCTDTVLNLVLTSGEELDISPCVVDFERLQERVQGRLEAYRGKPVAPLPTKEESAGDSWTSL